MSPQEHAADRRSVTALVARYQSAVLAFFSRRLADRTEAKDLTQEVFASLTRCGELDRIRDPERYVFQVAANLLRDRARRAGTRPEIQSEGSADPLERLVDDRSPERVLLGRESYAVFVDALRALPERARTIFVLNRFEEMTGRDIAMALGISQRLVEKEISRALRLLRERLP